MKIAVWAVHVHLLFSIESPQYGLCPADINAWFQKTEAEWKTEAPKIRLGRDSPSHVKENYIDIRNNLNPTVQELADIFKQDNARPHVSKTVRDFYSVQHMQLLPWPAYSPDMSPIEHVWNLVGWRLARDPRPAASKDELLLRIQAIWNSLPQADI
ncbi:transposable element Tcb2 transposase [Trichonephila clavipes]|uniref:Transposable element Tcb2 transposase n=1 Tax=Trichonephila clavipes TaxID=2585209 RepID=A0A8X6S6H4_TRICX|nr:transposable element Tcb2 transposase [Trichonephila clavipes]